MSYSFALALCLLMTPPTAQDARIVETLLRLKSVDVNQREDLKVAVLRYLEPLKGTEKYVDLVERLKLRGVEDELLGLALEKPEENAGVQAARLLLERGQEDLFTAVLQGDDQARAVQAAKALGMTPQGAGNKLLRPLVTSGNYPRAVRTAAAAGLGRNRGGQRFLLELAKEGGLADELKFAAANALFTSPDAEIRRRAGEYLELPAAAGAAAIPPVAELVKMPGDAARGQKLFESTATCGKCHKVRGQGKEVGPDLSEIGSKLSPEALFTSILDPSAGISHNYETYNAILDSGNIVSGLLVSRTDDRITLRTADAIDQSFAPGQIDEMIKSETSLMPADLQKTMTVQDLVDVVAYLQTLRK